MLPPYWHTAVAELAARDRILKELMPRFPDISLTSRGDAFATLARSIVGQQISTRASESVWQRLLALLPEPSPAALACVDDEALASSGLSQRKVGYLKDLSLHFLEGTLAVAHWADMDDEAIIADLMQVRGIGRWTAEMFLIFNLLRPDVLPLDDFGLQRAMSMHYNAGQPLSKLKMRAIAGQWQPWRSVATWYLWRSLDPAPIVY
jgi:DNA-3-methyladenine glycosylase II